MGARVEVRAVVVAAAAVVCLLYPLGAAAQRAGTRRDECFPGEERRTYETPDRAFPPVVENFSYSLFKLMARQQGDHSMIVSPYSVWSVLSIAYFGSLGNTQEEIENALGFVNKTHTIYNWKALKFYLENGAGDATLKVANRGYFSMAIDLNNCLTSEIFDLKHVDFKQSESARQAINQYVSDNTQGRIKELLTSLDPQTRFALINAVFFKGTWEKQFNPDLTSPQQFLVPPGKSSGVVQMMRREDSMIAGEAEGLDAMMVELPYVGSNISMYLLLPNGTRPNSLNDLISRLNPASFATAVRSLPFEPVLIELSVPRFKLTTRFEDELKNALSSLGISSLFMPFKANLRGFTKTSSLNVDAAIHQATVEVNEEGTVAAAAAGFLNTRFRQQVAFKLVFNRPFLFLIVDKNTRIPLFIGKVNSAQDLEEL